MIQSIERKLVALTSRLEELRQLKSIAQLEQWQFLSKAVERRILGAINQLCQDLPEPETRTMRAEVRALRWFLRIPQINDHEVEAVAERIAGLRKKAERLHTLGIGQSAEADTLSAEADALERKLEGTS